MTRVSPNITITYLKDKDKTLLYPRDTKKKVTSKWMDEFRKAENKEMMRDTAQIG